MSTCHEPRQISPLLPLFILLNFPFFPAQEKSCGREPTTEVEKKVCSSKRESSQHPKYIHIHISIECKYYSAGWTKRRHVDRLLWILQILWPFDCGAILTPQALPISATPPGNSPSSFRPTISYLPLCNRVIASRRKSVDLNPFYLAARRWPKSAH